MGTDFARSWDDEAVGDVFAAGMSAREAEVLDAGART
jgi:hypothetical protein